ncbi:MAG TPA: hypothetical protein PKY30_02365 [Myxococcota bacterium]|nr:hypothetical protein [Myxococcota bacterium]
MLGLFLLDFLAPLLFFSVFSAALVPEISGNLDGVIAASSGLEPSDANGTIWFWWWVHQATVSGKDLLNPDVVCAPAFQNLGVNFPNRIDALAALPFFHFLPFPRSYNMALLAVPVAGAMAAYPCFRRYTHYRLLAVLAAALFGFQAYTFGELIGGRPVTGLLATIPLFLFPFLAALETRSVGWWGWSVVAGAAGSLLVQHYIPFALFSLWFGLGAALLRTLWPAEGVPRYRPLVVGGITALLGLFLSGPYVHETLLVRKAGPTAAMYFKPKEPAALYETRLWTELADLWKTQKSFRGQLPPPSRASQRYVNVTEQSMPWSWLWKFPREEAGRRALVPMAMLVGASLLSMAGGRRGMVWWGAAFFFWLLVLGPYAAESVDRDRMRYLLVGGQTVPLPMAWILKALPDLSAFLRPYRIVPMMVFCLLMGMVVGGQRLLDLLQTRPGPLVRALSLVAVPLLASFLLGDLQRRLEGGRWIRLPHEAWAPPAFFQKMAADPEDYGIIELPVGVGHGAALLQVYHQKRRSEGHHDEMDAAASEKEPPKPCYTLPLVRSLWYLGLPGKDSLVEPGLSTEALQEARDAGFRYIVVYPSVYQSLQRRGSKVNPTVALERLTQILGPPEVQQRDLVVFRL